jgi:hypothetical protein
MLWGRSISFGIALFCVAFATEVRATSDVPIPNL